MFLNAIKEKATRGKTDESALPSAWS